VKVEAVVRRKTQDLVQDSAADLVRASLGGVRRVERAEVWTFDVEGAGAPDRVRRILEGTTLVVNPNVHRWSLEGHAAPPASGTRLLVRVQDRVDAKGRQVLRAVRERLGFREVRSAERAVQWTVDLETEDAAAAERAGRMLVGGERGAGILANGHAQTVEVRVLAAGG
jgi:phosphoribosylformylglycinamidine (FGAM) synthase PurS component